MRLIHWQKIGHIILLLCYCAISGFSQFQANYDESKIPDYKLPDPLLAEDNTKITNSKDWIEKRRPEIQRLFQTQVYGITPAMKYSMTFDVQTDQNTLDGKAIRKQVTLYPTGNPQDYHIEMLIYLPKGVSTPIPMFLGLNFSGNHTVHLDPGIKISSHWKENMKRSPKTESIDPETTRGSASSRWAIDMILKRGYGLATIYYGDIDPDFDDQFQNGVHPLFYTQGQTKSKEDEWGSIGAWAWGLSRAMDYFEKDPDIDQRHVSVMGHSRLGKTSLWAGAQDQRFAIVISNDSGCGGAALSLRRFGETVGRINRSFPHWFCDNFNQYNENEDALPVDQHMLISLMAPRPVYIASAFEDRWADPKGEFLSGKYASPVYQLFGKRGIGVDTMPDLNTPVGHTIGYHIRSGKHDVTDYDWKQYLDFADRHFQK